MARLLLVQAMHADYSVASDGPEKQKDQCKPERILVQAKHEPPTPDCPRCIRCAHLPWVHIDRFEGPDPLRLRRPALVQKGRQQHEDGHLQELAFPVLECRLPEVARSEVLGEPDRRVPVLAAFVVVVLQPGNSLPQPADKEERQESEREPVVSHLGYCASTAVRLGVTCISTSTPRTRSHRSADFCRSARRAR